MRERPRLWRWSGCVGITLSCLLLLAWLGSMKWRCLYNWFRITAHDETGRLVSMGFLEGCIEIGNFSGVLFGGEPGIYFGTRPHTPVRWLPAHFHNSYGSAYLLPLWIPLLLVAGPIAFLWWRDRHFIPTGYCQSCRYNLTGNVSGVCPECGEKI